MLTVLTQTSEVVNCMTAENTPTLNQTGPVSISG
jgi:hypothetical protein